MKTIINKASFPMILIILLLGQAVFLIMGCIQGNMGGNRKMPFQDPGISDGENELFYAGLINIRNFRAIGDGSTDNTSTISSAIQNASDKTLLIPAGTYRIASSLTIPSNVNVCFTNGAKIKVDSGKTLTISGRIIANRYQIFTGDGTVNITKGACDELYPEWWGAVGDGSTDDTTAMQKCITCASQDANVKVVRLGEKTYKITSALTTPGNAINIIGTSMNRSWILVSGGCDGLRITPYATGNQREQILLSNFRIYSDSVVTGYGIYISGHRDLTIEHVWIGGYYDNYKGFEYGIYALNQPTYYLRIRNSRIFYCKYGIYITGTANNAVIEHNTIRYGARLITLDYTSGTRIINNSIETDSGATNGGNPATERLITLTGNATNTVIANNYLEHHTYQTIELQSGCKRTRIYGNTHGVWLYDRSDVLDNSGNNTNAYDDKWVLRVNKDTNNYTTDNVGGIIDMTLGNYSDVQVSADWHPADMRIRASRGYLTLRTDAQNRHIELASHTDARTFNTPLGGFGKVYGNLLPYSETFNNWLKPGGTTIYDNSVVSPTGQINASRIIGDPGSGLMGLWSTGAPFTDGKIINFSIWVRSPAGKDKGTLQIYGHNGYCFDMDEDWCRYNVACVSYLNSGSPYDLAVYFRPQNVMEVFGAQFTINGTALTGTVNSKVSPNSYWLMDMSSNLKSKGADKGALVLVANGSARGFTYIDDVQSCIDFTNGNGTQPSVGDTVTGSANYARGVIAQIVVTSGSFANGNAEGWIRIKQVAGLFASGNTLTFPSATATCSAFYLNSIATFLYGTTDTLISIYGSKTSCANGDTYYIAPRESLVPQPYVATYGTAIANVDASFYSGTIATPALKASLGADLVMGDYNIHVSSSPTANKWSGLTVTLTAGENLSMGDVCYMNSSGKMVKADADSITTAGVIAIATATINNNASGVFLLQGVMHLHTLNPGWTVGGRLYLSTTAGAMTQIIPSDPDDVVQVLGTAIASDTVLFNPNLVMVERN